MIDAIDRDTVLREVNALATREDLLDTEGRAPIIRLVNHLLFDAVKAGASDVHIQPYEDRVIVRQRIDGVLFDSFEIPKAVQEEVLTRVKVLGKMNIAEKRLPQDGRATVQLGDRTVDLRIASLPTSHNERIVIRLLDKSARLYTLGELGMPPHYLDLFRQLINRDHGMILVTGPTGSGKSTTLYGALQEINSHDLNVLTLEDPIEYQLDGISQTQINEKKGMTFASGMRSVLRQDPDIIMVGEIRDSETAVMAIQASLTGHLVFSTLHTNDAASAVTRLLDLGIEPYLVSSSLVASLAQRLVRQLVADAKHGTRPATIPPPPRAVLQSTKGSRADDLVGVYRAVGCERCRGTGYRGRVGLFELLVVDDRCRELVQSRGNASQIREAALDAGMHLLATDGMLKVHQGVTTLDEVLGSRRSSPKADGSLFLHRRRSRFNDRQGHGRRRHSAPGPRSTSRPRRSGSQTCRVRDKDTTTLGRRVLAWHQARPSGRPRFTNWPCCCTPASPCWTRSIRSPSKTADRFARRSWVFAIEWPPVRRWPKRCANGPTCSTTHRCTWSKSARIPARSTRC